MILKEKLFFCKAKNNSNIDPKPKNLDVAIKYTRPSATRSKIIFGTGLRSMASKIKRNTGEIISRIVMIELKSIRLV